MSSKISANSLHFLHCPSNSVLRQKRRLLSSIAWYKDILGDYPFLFVPYPFHHANIILPIIPVPLFRIHVIAAAKGVALDSPTPIPLIMEWVVSVPVMVLAKACKNVDFIPVNRFVPVSGEERDKFRRVIVMQKVVCSVNRVQPLNVPIRGALTNLHRVPYLIGRVIRVHAVRVPLRQEYLFEDGREPRASGLELGGAEFRLARAETIWPTGRQHAINVGLKPRPPRRWSTTRSIAIATDISYLSTLRKRSPSRSRNFRETARAYSREVRGAEARGFTLVTTFANT